MIDLTKKEISLWVGRMASKRFIILLTTLLFLLSGMNFIYQFKLLKDVHLYDYPVYYRAGSRVLDGMQHLIYKDRYPTPDGRNFVVHEFQNLPIVALFFLPFGMFSFEQSKIVWSFFIIFCSILSFFSLCFILTIGMKREKKYFYYLLFFFVMVNYAPFYRSLDLGQTTPVCFLVFCWMYYFLRSYKDIAAGILLSFLFLIKIPFIMLIFYFFLIKRYRILISFFISMVIIVMLSTVMFGVDLHLQYFSNNILQFIGKGLGDFNNQSMDGFLIRTFIPCPLTGWIPIELNVWIKFLRLILNGGLITLATFIVAREEPPKTVACLNYQFILFLCLMLFVFPISWIHYYTFLILAYLLIFPIIWLNLKEGRVFMAVSFFISFLLTALHRVEPNYYYKAMENDIWQRIWCSHYFFGALILFIVCLILVKREHQISG